VPNDGGMALVHEVPVRTLPIERLEPVIGRERYEQLTSVGTRLRNELGDRTIWNINSTAVGGGVAEMLQVLVGYVADTGIRIRWDTITGEVANVTLTRKGKRRAGGLFRASTPGALGD